MTRVLLLTLVLAGCSSAVPRADLGDGPTGTIQFATQSPTGTEFIQGMRTARAVVISGELTLPRGAKGRGPAVVLLHGSHGVGGNMPFWRSELTGIGVATFIVDSFGGRGVRETATDQSRVSTAAMVVDAYRALALLATHPAVDPARIAVMGFSKGGTVSAAASLERFYQVWGPAGVRFRAHLPFYPSCTIQLFDEARVAAPIRIFHGSADDWTPIAPCRAYVDRLRAAGVDARLIELPGALHGFDVPTLLASQYLPRVQSSAGCRIVERAPGEFVDTATGLQATPGAPCVGLGATVGYHAPSQRAAAAAAKEFLRATLTP